MKNRLVWTAVLAGACISAGVSAQDHTQTVLSQQTKNLEIKCTSKNECDMKWGRALAWVSQNSTFKVRLATDSIITTEGPIDEFGYRTLSTFIINKVPLAGGTYRIEFSSGCLSTAGCVPSHNELFASFGAYVDPAASAAAVAAGQKGRLGVGVFPLDRPGRSALRVPYDYGLIIGAVQPGSAAEKSGLVKSDILLKCNDKPLRSSAELIAAAQAASGSLRLRVLRGGREIDIEVPL